MTSSQKDDYMLRNARCWLAWAMFDCGVCSLCTRRWRRALRAYPDAHARGRQLRRGCQEPALPLMKYVVNAIGAKVHPEEFQVTSSGQVMVPLYAPTGAACAWRH